MRNSLVVLFSILWLILPIFVSADPAGEASPEALWQAARDGDSAQVRHLLKQGVPVDAKTEFECTALYFAANSNHADVIKILLEAGADADVRDNSYGFTAVAMAAWLGHADAVAALLDGGANADDAVGGMFAAAGNGHVAVVETYLRKLELESSQLQAVLATAQQAGQDGVVAVLQKAGVKLPEAEASSDGASASSSTPEESGAAEPAAPEAPTLAPDRPIQVAKAAPWPEFRGLDRSGVADGQHPPLSWNLDTGRNVRWRTPVEGLGLSSPIVWGNHVFVTTAVSPETEQTVDAGELGNIDVKRETARHEWQLHAYDLSSGELLWKRTAHAGAPRSQRHWKASQANPTAATDGKIVVVSFGSEGLYAYDFQGEQLWKQDLGTLVSGWFMDPAFEWGFASSPILAGERVIVQIDVHGDSFVAAFAAKNGEPLWRTMREELPSWGTPLHYRDENHEELVLVASGAVVGYDPNDGKELWRVRGNSQITVASPIAQPDLIVATGGYRTPKVIYAVKPGARGDVTPEEGGSNEDVVWSKQGDGAYNVTPLLYRGLLYICRDNGGLTVYDVANGEQIYRERLRGRYTASPVAADGRVYFTNEDGDVTVLQAGRTFRVLAESELGHASLSTPAVSNGLLIFRTVRGLVGVGFPDPS